MLGILAKNMDKWNWVYTEFCAGWGYFANMAISG